MTASIVDFDALARHESPDAVAVLNRDGETLHWNKGAEHVFGYSAAEAVGQRIAALIAPPNLREEQESQLSDTLARGFATFESLRRRRDGTLVYVDISCKVIQDAAEAAPMILCSMKDVTGLRVMRDAKQVEARYRDLLESTPDSIVMANLTGHIVFANEHAETLFGYGRGELHGKPIETLLPPRFRTAHLAHRGRYFEQPRTRAMGAGLDLYGLRRDGTEFPVEISLSPMRDRRDRPRHERDPRHRRERKRFEHELREKNLAARGRDAGRRTGSSRA